MNSENICLSSKTIEIAETDTYLELTNRVCFYDEANLNNVELVSDGALKKAETLVNMPVVAKYTTYNDKPTFKGHEVYIDDDGDVAFGTDNIGTHTEIYIQDDTVDVSGAQKTLPCLFAKYRIWKRNKNVVAAAKRLYSEGKLYSSWEISTLAYEFKNGIKKLTDYVFLSNCLLGYENAFPAYGTDAKAISMSEYAPELLIAEAFAQDKILQESEDDKLSKINKDEKVTEVAEEEVVVNETVASETKEEATEEVTETSALTDWDLRKKLNQACRAKLDLWAWVAWLFPTEQTCWVEYEGRETETDFKLFTYTVANDEVAVSEPTDVKLMVSVAEINSTVASYEEKIETLNSSLVEASSTIQNLNTEISNLNTYKEKFEEAEQIKIAKELSDKQDMLKVYATKSGFITEEELTTSEEIKACIENVDEAGIKAIIAERFMETLDKNKEVKLDTSALELVESKVNAKANISDGDADKIVTPKSVMKSYLSK